MTAKPQDLTHFWNDYYEKRSEYDPTQALEDQALEEALSWLSENGGTILDIGCGSGEMACRCLSKGALKLIGLDSSFHGISLARRSSGQHFSTLKTKWIWGNLGSLKQLPDACAQGVILSDLFSYLNEEEKKFVLAEVERLLDHQGRILYRFDSDSPAINFPISMVLNSAVKSERFEIHTMTYTD